MIDKKKKSIIIISPLIGFIVGLLVYFSKRPIFEIKHFEFIINTIISTSTTVSGFILASVTILVGATDSKIMKAIQKNGAHRELRMRYSETLILGLFQVLFFVFIGSAVEDSSQLSNLQISLSAGLLTSYICSVISTCYYLLSIIGLINDSVPTISDKPIAPTGKYRI